MASRLAKELSPYLQQHADNLVDWYPWGDEAFEKARRENKPIFLSIGYSSCHWCHVMAEESFNDPQVAAVLNNEFVPVKVDREERPDVDQFYIDAVQLLVGHAGWPLSVFLTPDLEPFFGGTYWPPRSTGDTVGFLEMLQAVSSAWKERKEEIVTSAKQFAATLQQHLTPLIEVEHPSVGKDLFASAADAMREIYDRQFGGFGRMPKFPSFVSLRFLLWHGSYNRDEGLLHMVRHSLDAMAKGGIRDHIGGGFHRYSTDAAWTIPHFEKMLYDNALAITVFTEAFQATGEARYAAVAKDTAEYLLRELQLPEGGFASSHDADNAQGEGMFYLWSESEIRDILGSQDADLFLQHYALVDIDDSAQRGVLIKREVTEPEDEVTERRLALLRQQLYQARNRRPVPFRDDKVIVAWNGLAIEALSTLGSLLEQPRYLSAAERCAQFLLHEVRLPDGSLAHYSRSGQAKQQAFLDDYANLVWGLINLYRATFDPQWIKEGDKLLQQLLALFLDEEAAVFYYRSLRSTGEEQRLTRIDLFDSAEPSGTGTVLLCLIWLGELLGRSEYIHMAEKITERLGAAIERIPLGCGQALLASLLLRRLRTMLVAVSPREEPLKDFLRQFRSKLLPHILLAARVHDGGGSSQELPTIKGKSAVEGQLTIYACKNFTCGRPVVGLDACLQFLDSLGSQ